MAQPELSFLYKVMFKEYPDVVNAEQLGQMLGGISTKTVYHILESGKIKSLYLGKRYRIPKVFVIDYLISLEKPKSERMPNR